jgi:hypothetical protein
MRQAKAMPNLRSRLTALREILPPSLERNLLIDEALQAELDATGWIEQSILQGSGYSEQPDIGVANLRTKLLTAAVSVFPGPMAGLVLLLDGRETPRDLAQQILQAIPKHKADDRLLAEIEKALQILQSHFCEHLSNKARRHQIQHALASAIALLHDPAIALHTIDGKTPYQLYVPPHAPHVAARSL